ncbi:MAG: hypothetical protein MUF55_01170 [Hydrogenophaga sp.]|jgi:hypothetical protein|nr:hypothetical protein [Hydrogenophaga sp.]
MKMTMVSVLSALWLVSAPALAQDASCSAAAADRKLAGAAKTSFLTKCEKDARARCEEGATEKKLHGAARNSHVNKCVRDAVGG